MFSCVAQIPNDHSEIFEFPSFSNSFVNELFSCVVFFVVVSGVLIDFCFLPMLLTLVPSHTVRRFPGHKILLPAIHINILIYSDYVIFKHEIVIT